MNETLDLELNNTVSLGIRRNNVNYIKEGLDRLNGNINAIRNNNRGKF